MTNKDVTLRISTNAVSRRCTLEWVQGKITKPFTLPDTGSVRVLLGIALQEPGRQCDTVFSIQ